MAVNYNPRTVINGLILYLDAANIKSYPGTGTVWTDLSGNGNTGTLINGPTFNSNNGGSIVFDGSNDYIELASPGSKWSWTPTGAGNNTLTFEFWVKSTDTAGDYVSKPWNGNGEYNYEISHNNWSTIVGAQSHSLAFTSLATGNWEHIVAMVTPTQKAIYRNGVINANFTNHNITVNTPTSGNASAPLSIMTLYPYGTGVWSYPTHAITGNLSNLKIYNRILTDREVAANFNALRGRFGL